VAKDAEAFQMYRVPSRLATLLAIPVTDRGGLYGCEMSRIPHCLDNRLTDDCEYVSLTHRLRFTLRNIFLYVWGGPPTLMIILILMRVNHFIYTMYTIYTDVTSNE
jgi:hypothetical protein